MPVIVPRQRTDALAGLDTERCQRVGQLARSREHLAIGLPPSGVVQRDGDDFPRGVIFLGETQQRGNQQRIVHHQAVHRVVLVKYPG